MKNLKTLFVLIVIITFSATAQQRAGREKKEQIKALKVSFITTELEMSSEESTKFWPIYNAFEAKQQQIRSSKTKSLITKITNEDLNKMSDKEAANLLSKLEVTEDELFQNRKKLISNLKSILTPIKILKFKRAEDNFNKKLLKQYRNKH